MNVLTRITAVIIIILGILGMVAGVLTGIFGAYNMGVGAQPFGNMPGAPFNQPNMMNFGFGLVVGIIIFIQGLVVTALGEVVYMVAVIAQNTRQLA